MGSKASQRSEGSPLRSKAALGADAESAGLNDSPDHWRFYRDPYGSYANVQVVTEKDGEEGSARGSVRESPRESARDGYGDRDLDTRRRRRQGERDACSPLRKVRPNK